jgi:hypothetical protein
MQAKARWLVKYHLPMTPDRLTISGVASAADAMAKSLADDVLAIGGAA